VCQEQFNNCIDVNQEDLEDIKGVIRIRKSKIDRQHNGQKKKDKRTNNDLQNIYIEVKIELHEPHLKPEWTQVLLKMFYFHLLVKMAKEIC
jgi:hypothetical protein